VAGGVHDVDTGVFPFNAGGFREDGDTTFTFQVVAVHGTFGHSLVFTEGARLLQQLIHEGGFAVVNVGDDGDVAQIHKAVLDCSPPGYTGSAQKASEIGGNYKLCAKIAVFDTIGWVLRVIDM
jgi:hypothetical protein